MVPSPRVLVVGAGCTGAAVSRALRRRLPAECVVVWESSDAVGGRMRNELASVAGLSALTDSGAQYITQEDSVRSEHAELYSSLTDSGVLVPFNGRIEGTRAADGGGANYVCPVGLGAVVGHLFAEAGVTPVCGRGAASMRVDSAGARWNVHSGSDSFESFDGVVLTAPVPLQLELLRASGLDSWLGTKTVAAGQARERLEGLQYSARYALSLFFAPEHAGLFSANLDWVAKYVSKDEDDGVRASPEP